MTTTELAIDARAALGEGALWHKATQRLFWVDILGCEVHLFDPLSGQDRVYDVGELVGTVVPRQQGGAVVALQTGFAILDLDSGAVEPLTDPEADRPSNRFNDGKCDPAGRLWAGTMSTGDTAPCGALYCLDRDHSVNRVLDGVQISNGIAWSADRQTMYYIDTPLQRVDAFDYEIDTGAIRNRRTIIEVDPQLGFPDGMTIDVDGLLWVAHWGGRAVRCWNPQTGELVASVEVPAVQVTSCAFGGVDLDELYITTARTGLDEAALADQPQAGGVFVAKPGARGVPAFEFAG